jgi:hypothetical protein
LSWWTRLQPIRTASELKLDFVVFTSEPFLFHRIAAEAHTLRKLGMSLRAIGAAVGVDEKTVRKALARKHPSVTASSSTALVQQKPE